MKSSGEQYGELETKHKESELAHEEILAKKNECLEMLKKELETVNEIIDNLKSDDPIKDLEGKVKISLCLFFKFLLLLT